MLPIDRCSGCMACGAVCPKNCISQKESPDGFMYPSIDSAQCVNCKACEAVCPILKVAECKEANSTTAYASYTNNESTRLASSSGGCFYSIAKVVLEHNGFVFGAAFDDELSVRHICISSVDDLYKLQGSKYVQSDIGNCYSQVKSLLEANEYVLFSGTPCQIEGLLSFLKKDYDTLITVDIICHGVPSPKAWRAYVDWQKMRNKADLITASFRDKTTGWKRFSMRLEFEGNKSYLNDLNTDPYLVSFLSNLTLRESCYDCAFKGEYRKSDITIADLWGAEVLAPDMFDDKGCSLLLPHSDKGYAIINDISHQCELLKIDYRAAVDHNSAMNHSSDRNPLRDYFFYYLGKKPFDKLLKECQSPSLLVRAKRKLIINNQR